MAELAEWLALALALGFELVRLAPALAPARAAWSPADLPGRLAGLPECPAGLPARGRPACGSLSATSCPENAVARDGSFRVRTGEAGTRVWVAVVGGDPPTPATREIRNAAPKAATASTVPVATSLTTSTA